MTYILIVVVAVLLFLLFFGVQQHRSKAARPGAHAKPKTDESTERVTVSELYRRQFGEDL